MAVGRSKLPVSELHFWIPYHLILYQNWLEDKGVKLELTHFIHLLHLEDYQHWYGTLWSCSCIGWRYLTQYTRVRYIRKAVI